MKNQKNPNDNLETYVDTPLKVKLIDSIGMRDFFVNNFIFARNKSSKNKTKLLIHLKKINDLSSHMLNSI